MDNNWSIEAIEETAANNWSLEGDNQLLNLMKSISKNLEQRCMTSNNNLNRLMLDVDKTKIKLRNATTKLLDLNNAKFVEHTVMDMDSTLSNTEKCSTPENDKAFVTLPKAVEEAVTNGLDMMDRCYEKVLLNLEDSEDEDENENVQKHVVCRPKNPYLNRPLPHLIGSKQWNDKWHIGLIESDEEVLSDEEPEEPEFSQSSSDEEDSLSNSPRTSNAPTTSESDFAAPVPAFIPPEDLFHRLADDNETKSSIFAPEDNKHREKVKVLPTAVPSIQNDVKNESTNKIKQLTEPPAVPASEQPKQSIFVQQRTEPKFLNLFDDEPPSLDEPIRNERRPVNLFLDSDDDDDNNPVPDTRKPSSIFNNNVASRSAPPFSIPQIDNVPKVDKTQNAFHGDVDNNNVPPVAKGEMKSTVKSNDFGGLFDDEPPDDFFDIIVREQGGKNGDSRKAEKPTLQSKTVNLFESDDEDDDDFSKIIGTTKKKDSAVPGVSSKESTPAAKQVESAYSPFNSPFKSFTNTAPPKSYVSFLDDVDDGEKEIAAAAPLSRTSLFDDTSPEDIVIPVGHSNRDLPKKIIYDDIAATLQEKFATTANISSENLNNETSRSDDVSVKAPPVAKPRKSQSNVIHGNVVDKSKGIVADEIFVSNTEPKSDDGTRDEIDQSASFRKNLSMFSNPAASTLTTVDRESKPKPNKLKTNFSINVAALLPGAKLPSQKQPTTEKPERTVEPDPEPEKIENVSKDSGNSVSSVKQISSSDDTSGRLTSLSKNRPRIQVQRKPSTRTGRQNLYNKTLIAESENVVSSVETTDSVSPVIKDQEQVIDAAPLENVPKSDVDDSDWLSEKTAYDEPPPLESNNSSPNVVVDSDPNVVDDEEDWLKNIDETLSPSKTNLYEDDWLSTKEVNVEQKPPTQNMSHVMNYDWLTASSLPPEDINPPSSYSIDDDHEQDDWLTSYMSKEKSSVVADLPNEDDDWLITSATQERSREAATIVASEKGKEEVEKDWLLEATLEPEKNVNEKTNDDDDDWFTKSLAPPKPSTSETDKRSVSETVNKRSTEPQAERSGTIDSNAETRQTVKPKLFDSDDENATATANELTRSKLDFDRNSSDIFGPKPETKSFLSSTIFDDDVDDFTAVPSVNLGRASEPDVMKQNPLPTTDFVGESFKSKTETKKSVNSKLFDDDDDDDLFTSISQKQSSARQTANEAVKTTNVSIKASAKSLFSDDDNSDPDDLFGTTTKKQKNKIEAGHKKKMEKPTKAVSLFDDEDDDDDDIFAPKTQRQRVTQADTKKKPSITKSVTTIPASNDPLADLLK